MAMARSYVNYYSYSSETSKEKVKHVSLLSEFTGGKKSHKNSFISRKELSFSLRKKLKDQLIFFVTKHVINNYYLKL